LREFDALLARRKYTENHARLNAGIIAAAVYNTAPYGDPDRKAVNPLDFVSEWKKDVGEFDLSKLSPEKQAEYVRKQMSKKIFNRRGR
jgi:hypothetical protein